MKRVFDLLDKARDLCGSDAALARRLGIDPAHPAQWRSGKRTITPATVGLLADVVGLDAQDATRLALLAVVAGVKDPEKAGILKRVFLSWAACVVAAPGMALNDAQASAVTTEPPFDISTVADLLRSHQVSGDYLRSQLSRVKTVYTLSRLCLMRGALAAFSAASQYLTPTASSATALASRIEAA